MGIRIVSLNTLEYPLLVEEFGLLFATIIQAVNSLTNIIIEPIKTPRKPSARRQPSCLRGPSRRLHPTPQQEILSTNQNHSQLRTSAAASTSLFPVADQTSSSSSEDEDYLQRPASPIVPNNIVPAGAMAAQRKFISPPTFSAKPGENAQDWMERYELTGRYNRWDAAEMRANFVMYLEGTARKWFLFTNVPADWEDQVAVAATATVAAIPFVAGLRTVFLQEFRQDNFALIQKAKLRKRFQGENEDATSYYYDVLHMCHVINPGMTQTQILEHLYNGLRRSLLKKIYPLKPRTSAEFLEMVKIHTETSILLNRRSYDEQNASTSAAASVSMISQQQSNWKDNLDLEKRLIELQKSLADLKEEYNSSMTE